MSGDDARILVVDDVAPNVRLLEAVLAPRGYDVVSATDGDSALELVASAKPDLVMLDVVMPQPDGYAVCRRIRENEDTAMLPVIMITASTSERTEAIRAGADDLIAKPFDQDELLARVRSLLRIKRYHDTITSQAAELTELNRTLEERVQTQVVELERVRKLRRFLSPQLVDAIVSTGDDAILRSHRRKVAMFFADLRGWTSFVDAVEPEELMQVLGEFHSRDRRSRATLRCDRGVPRGRRGPALLQRPPRGPRRSAPRGPAGVRAPGGDGGADAGVAQARLRAGPGVPASRSATRRAARSDSKAAPTTRRSAR